VDLDVAEDFGRLPPDTELVLFRVVQEALTNVSRHSHSQAARIELTRRGITNGTNVELSIEDAGQGMPQTGILALIAARRTPAVAQGVGLASMRERLQQIGGRLEIESEAGRTCIKATVPLED
jgi:signal transduction histidine kinase